VAGGELCYRLKDELPQVRGVGKQKNGEGKEELEGNRELATYDRPAVQTLRVLAEFVGKEE